MAAIAHDHHPLPNGLVTPRRGRADHLTLVPPTTSRVRRATAATYRRRRLVAVALLAALLVATVAAAGSVVSSWHVAAAVPASSPAAVADAASGPAAVGATAYVVQPGDSVWSIARRVKPTGDVRDLVDRIVARNGGASLRPGQVLVLG